MEYPATPREGIMRAFINYMFKDEYILVRDESPTNYYGFFLNLNDSIEYNIELLKLIENKHGRKFYLTKNTAKYLYGNKILKNEKFLQLYPYLRHGKKYES